ncbi:NlpC/P60 family protein [Buttiauxella sp.]|uniref:NlpC/P60 family protein n=1 Tax=Buttiauxella sp. TaxID=1972222 RepID=UPI003C795E3B
MPRFKNLVALIFVVAPLMFSANSFAFNMPKEFASIGTKSVSHKNSFFEKENYTKQINGSDDGNIRSAILSQYSNWKGTRYHLGGTTHKGVDCSALMQHIFSESFGKSLPRTTTQQIQNGEQVSKETLKPGDLVFFKTSPGMRHVGVYVGDNKFIHASSSEGVTMSSLANHYWVDHYETARRLNVMS